jgi:hypothetical protein
VSEQGLPQISNSELLADLEAILLELRHRLDNYLGLAADEPIAGDEGFNFAGSSGNTERRSWARHQRSETARREIQRDS